jgi:hypothetical protein
VQKKYVSTGEKSRLIPQIFDLFLLGVSC